MTAPAEHRDPPTALRRVGEAEDRYGERASAYLSGMWRGDPLADAFVADFATVGHGRAMGMLRRACREGIDTVAEAPESLRALFAELDQVPDWVDLETLARDTRHLARYTRQAGIVLGAASLVAGYANAAASRPLQLTGRYVESAGVRTIEVGSWLVAVNAAHGLARFSPGFELTVRVRIIHALVRHSLRGSPDWDLAAWGVPICQSYLAYTLVEFCLIPIRGMRAIGAPYLPHEVDAQYRLWRYVGHLLGIEEDLLPVDRAGQELLEHLYLLTRPVVDDYCRDLARGINTEFVVPEIEQLLPRPLHTLAPPMVHALERVFLGDPVAEELAIPATRLTGPVRAVGPLLGVVNGALDRVPGLLALRTTAGRRYRERQDRRLRERYAVRHDLVDASPAGGRPHPARGVDG